MNVAFRRSIINRTNLEIEDWKEQMEHWIDQIERDKKGNYFAKNCSGQACSMYRGCQFKELCKASKGMEVDEEIAEVLYVQEDPYGYLKEPAIAGEPVIIEPVKEVASGHEPGTTEGS